MEHENDFRNLEIDRQYGREDEEEVREWDTNSPSYANLKALQIQFEGWLGFGNYWSDFSDCDPKEAVLTNEDGDEITFYKGTYDLETSNGDKFLELSYVAILALLTALYKGRYPETKLERVAA